MGKTKEAVERVVFDARCGDIRIEYEAKPKRLYRVRKGETDPWVEVPSVTTVLDVLSKDGLPWWGQNVALDGVCKLWKFPDGFITVGRDGELVCWDDQEQNYVVATQEALTRLLTARKMTVNHVRDEAGDRGQTVHDAFQAWADERVVPDPVFYPESERGYVEALIEFIRDVGTVAKPFSEVMVGSVEHGFAGRYDLECTLPKPVSLRTRRGSPGGRRPESRDDFSGRVLFDLKTSKGVYASHHIQLEAYELARIEGGQPATDHRIVIQVASDGTYEVTPSQATGQDFLNVLATYHSIQRLKGR